MTKRTKLLLAALAGVILVCAAYVGYYTYYWQPVRDLRALGFDFIRPWTPNSFRGDYGIDGWIEEYRFEISLETEKSLRPLCRDDPAIDTEKTTGACWLVVRHEEGAPTIEVKLEAQGLLISYIVAPPLRDLD